MNLSTIAQRLRGIYDLPKLLMKVKRRKQGLKREGGVEIEASGTFSPGIKVKRKNNLLMLQCSIHN
jgi:hypothetical protein